MKNQGSLRFSKITRTYGPLIRNSPHNQEPGSLILKNKLKTPEQVVLLILKYWEKKKKKRPWLLRKANTRQLLIYSISMTSIAIEVFATFPFTNQTLKVHSHLMLNQC
jgi:hypothetical protein